MKLILLTLISGLTGISLRDFSSYSSSRSFSSSYSNWNGKEHSESSSEESYSERDSNGLNRSGSGKLLTRDGRQIYEETKLCDSGKCLNEVDTAKHRLRTINI
jgi:hypothetical protein